MHTTGFQKQCQPGEESREESVRWNGNPYRLDGGDGGRTEEDGTFFLLPYWMARYHGLFEGD